MLNNSINLNFLIGINIVKNEKVHKIAEGNTAEIFEIDDKKAPVSDSQTWNCCASSA